MFDRPMRRWLVWFVACGIGGALLDQLHTHLGVLSYREPVLFGQAWWVAPNFGFGGLVFLALGLVIAKRAGAALPLPSDRRLLIESAWFLGAYLISCFFFEHPWLMSCSFAAVWAVRIASGPAKPSFLLYSLIVAALGTGYELTVTSTGSYWFHHPDVHTVPAWLPGLYLNGAPLGLHLAKKL
jgi:hypothetical protein